MDATVPPHNRQDALEAIALVIRQSLARPDLAVSETTRAEDVHEWDSLAHIRIILTVEKTFGIRLGAADVAGLENVGSFVDVVMALTTR